jgi:hypothetical protein
VTTTVETVDPDGRFSTLSPDVPGVAADLAAAADGRLVAAVVQDQSELLTIRGSAPGFATPAELAGVAFGSGYRVFVATRAPFQLLEAWSGEDPVVAPGGGLALFDRATNGVACASCHPDGGDDGHVWDVGDAGPRKTMALGGGLLSTAPFHWEGDLADLDALYAEIGIGRMSLPPPWGDQIDQLGAWLDELPVTPTGPAPDEAAIARGRARFDDPDVGCSGCHVAPRFTSDGSYDVGTGGRFQVPSLPIGERAPAGDARRLR